MSRWKNIRHSLEHAAAVAMSRMVPHLSRPALLTSANLLGQLAFRIDRRGRATALENLHLIFPDWPAGKHAEIALASYRNLARTVLDLFWSPNLTPQNRHHYIREDLHIDPSHPHSSTLWITPHFGNFEWLSISSGLFGSQIKIIAQDFKNPALTPIFQALRTSTGNQAIPRNRAAIRLFKHLKGGGQSALLSDLTIRPSNAATIIECFGRKVSVTALHGVLASRTGASITTAYSLPKNDGTYTHVIGPAFDVGNATPQEIAQRCWDEFEPVIREHPEYWMWPYKFWRYLPADTDPATYPSYANRSKPFDRLLNSQSQPGSSPQS
ncbi:MAG: lysophospholipid acyltransferase family protein [Verrucomicrobiales bacterium]|nr:lysophospholipid acyltransferase family protein [Verrucomicrobiales bacterium]